MWLLAQDY
jgi:hypothetical protein